MSTSIPASLRAAGRSALYGTPLHRVVAWAARRMGRPLRGASAEHWDAELAGRARAYLGGTVNNDIRDSVTANLVRHAAPWAASVMDVGCAAGSLGRALRRGGLRRYVGVDISRVAIDAADPSVGEFHVTDLTAFDPRPHGPFDVVVFNEVLYYCPVAEAVSELARYSSCLAPGGVVVFSLKDDPKSRAILGASRSAFDVVTSVLFQEQPAGGRWSVRSNRERPAYLVSVARPRSETAAPDGR